MQTKANPLSPNRSVAVHKSSIQKDSFVKEFFLDNYRNENIYESKPKIQSEDNAITRAALFGHQFGKIENDVPALPTVEPARPVIQLKDNKKKKGRKTKVKAIPPKLDIPISDLFNLDLGSSGIGLGYDQKDFSSRFGINPLKKSLSIENSYKQANFKGGVGLDGGFSAGFSYGLPLLPFPHELKDVMLDGGQALTDSVMQLPAFLKNPVDNYGAQKENFSLIGKAGSMLSNLFGQKETQDSFGVGLDLKFNPKANEEEGEERFRAMAGFRKTF